MNTSCLFCNYSISLKTLFEQAIFISSDYRSITACCPNCGKTFEIHLFQTGIICACIGDPPQNQKNLIPISFLKAVKTKDNSGIHITARDEQNELIFSGVIPFYVAQYSISTVKKETISAKKSPPDFIASEDTEEVTTHVNTETSSNKASNSQNTENEINEIIEDSREGLNNVISIFKDLYTNIVNKIQERKIKNKLIIGGGGVMLAIIVFFMISAPSSDKYFRLLPKEALGDSCSSPNAYISFSTFTNEISDNLEPLNHLAFLEQGSNTISYFSVINSSDNDDFTHEWYKNGKKIARYSHDISITSRAMVSEISIDVDHDDIIEVVTLDDNECFVGREPILVTDKSHIPHSKQKGPIFMERIYESGDFDYIVESRSRDKINIRFSSGDTPLIHAIRHNDLYSLKKLLKKGADPYDRDYLGLTATQIAKYNNFDEIYEYLIDRYPTKEESSDKWKRFDDEDYDSKAIASCYPKSHGDFIDGGNIYMIRNLLRECSSRDANLPKYWLFKAVKEHKNKSVFLYLLSMGVDPNYKRSGDDSNVLYNYAIKNGQQWMAYQLLNYGLDPTIEVKELGFSPVAQAVQFCEYKSLAFMYDNGIDFNRYAEELPVFLPNLIHGCPATKRWQTLKNQILSSIDSDQKVAISEYDADMQTVSNLLNDYHKRYPICANFSGMHDIPPKDNPDDDNSPFTIKAYSFGHEYYFTSNIKPYFIKQPLIDSENKIQQIEKLCFGDVSISNIYVSREYTNHESYAKYHESYLKRFEKNKSQTIIDVYFDININQLPPWPQKMLDEPKIKRPIEKSRKKQHLKFYLSDKGWKIPIESKYSHNMLFWLPSNEKPEESK